MCPFSQGPLEFINPEYHYAREKLLQPESPHLLTCDVEYMTLSLFLKGTGSPVRV